MNKKARKLQSLKRKVQLLKRRRQLAKELQTDSNHHLKTADSPEKKRWFKDDLKSRARDIKRLSAAIEKTERTIAELEQESK